MKFFCAKKGIEISPEKVEYWCSRQQGKKGCKQLRVRMRRPFDKGFKYALFSIFKNLVIVRGGSYGTRTARGKRF